MATFDGMEFQEECEEEYDIEANIKTEIGTLDIRMPSKEFTCREEPGFYDLGGMLVVSCRTKVVFVNKDGTTEEVAPVVIESCMNPGQKEIVPITYFVEDGESTIVISNTYKRIVVYDVDKFKSIYTKAYEPSIEKHSCNPCNNCGRC